MKLYSKNLLNKKILLLSDYVDPKEYYPQELEDETNIINSIADDMQKYNIDYTYAEVKNVTEAKKLIASFAKEGSVIFNWYEGGGDFDATLAVAKYLEDENYVFTGSNFECLRTNQNKLLTKKILDNNKVSTPKTYTVENVVYPAIVKFVDTHSSIGITKNNVANNKQDLEKIITLMGAPMSKIMIEEFISGEEITVHVWGNGINTEIIAIINVEYIDSTINNIQSENAKFNCDSDEYKNTKNTYDKEREKELLPVISDSILTAYDKLGFTDYARFELRISETGAHYVIDSNANPMLEITLLLALDKIGYGVGEFVLQTCEFALIRHDK